MVSGDENVGRQRLVGVSAEGVLDLLELGLEEVLKED